VADAVIVVRTLSGAHVLQAQRIIAACLARAVAAMSGSARHRRCGRASTAGSTSSASADRRARVTARASAACGRATCSCAHRRPRAITCASAARGCGTCSCAHRRPRAAACASAACGRGRATCSCAHRRPRAAARASAACGCGRPTRSFAHRSTGAAACRASAPCGCVTCSFAHWRARARRSVGRRRALGAGTRAGRWVVIATRAPASAHANSGRAASGVDTRLRSTRQPEIALVVVPARASFRARGA
jgi:hypothetical protein